ncbi:MAG: alpha/beta hydrolase [Chthoniobacterales bacterium]|nr:alpha/beta hydrolase [Chthoniobacterales bacterium]
MSAFWKKGFGVGLGAGLLGAAVVALRLRTRPVPAPSLPDIISPSVFARRVQRTTRGQMVYHASGEGDPVVFLHDFFPGASSYEWSKIYPAFVPARRVVAPDWIGFGESERPDRLLRAEDYAQSLFEFCRATCAGRRPVIVASGIGAALACLAAAQHPEFVSRLILFHPSGTEGWLAGWAPAPARAASWSGRGRRWIYANYCAPPAAIGKWLSSRRSEGPPALDLEEPVSVYSSFARQYGAGWAIQRIMSGRFATGALPRLENVCVPVTVLWPDLAGHLPAALSRPEPEVRLDHLPGFGSLAPLDRSADLAARLRVELFSPVRVAEA